MRRFMADRLGKVAGVLGRQQNRLLALKLNGNHIGVPADAPIRLLLRDT
jgi:hypothetical protein